MERKEETKAVKNALIKWGIDKKHLKVRHGNGTAWGWLYVRLDIPHNNDCTCKIYEDRPRETCAGCSKKWHYYDKKVEEITLQASGRKGYYAENVLVEIGFIE